MWRKKNGKRAEKKNQFLALIPHKSGNIPGKGLVVKTITCWCCCARFAPQVSNFQPAQFLMIPNQTTEKQTG
jgi:hypothetical protein